MPRLSRLIFLLVIPFHTAMLHASFDASEERVFFRHDLSTFSRMDTLEKFATKQVGGTTCGVVSAVMVLNYFGYEDVNEHNFWKAPQLKKNLSSSRRLMLQKVVQVAGLTLPQLTRVLNAYPGIEATAYSALPGYGAKRFVTKLNEVFKSGDRSRLVIVNYDMKILHGYGDGHFGVLGAFDPYRKTVLLVDPWYSVDLQWVRTSFMFTAMATRDMITNAPRGYIVVQQTEPPTHMKTVPKGINLEYENDENESSSNSSFSGGPDNFVNLQIHSDPKPIRKKPFREFFGF